MDLYLVGTKSVWLQKKLVILTPQKNIFTFFVTNQMVKEYIDIHKKSLV